MIFSLILQTIIIAQMLSSGGRGYDTVGYGDNFCFYRVTACNPMHNIAIAILSVRLSVRRVYCDKTKWCTADILIPHETAITRGF